MNVEEFKSSFDDVARPNRFRISGGLTMAGTGGAGGIPSPMLCVATQLPGKQIGTFVHRHNQGEPFKLPNDIIYPEVSFTFINEASGVNGPYSNKQYFSKWFDQVFNRETGRFNYYDTYANANLTIEQLDQQGNVIYFAILIGCYPIALAAQELSAEPSSAPSMFGVTISYHSLIESGYEGHGGALNLSSMISGGNLPSVNSFVDSVKTDLISSISGGLSPSELFDVKNRLGREVDKIIPNIKSTLTSGAAGAIQNRLRTAVHQIVPNISSVPNLNNVLGKAVQNLTSNIPSIVRANDLMSIGGSLSNRVSSFTRNIPTKLFSGGLSKVSSALSKAVSGFSSFF